MTRIVSIIIIIVIIIIYYIVMIIIVNIKFVYLSNQVVEVTFPAIVAGLATTVHFLRAREPFGVSPPLARLGSPTHSRSRFALTHLPLPCHPTAPLRPPRVAPFYINPRFVLASSPLSAGK